MNLLMPIAGCIVIVFGIYTLLNQERKLRLSQKYLRQNVGEVGKAYAERGERHHMLFPGIGAIALGIVLVFRALD